jgi:hypothetical protein
MAHGHFHLPDGAPGGQQNHGKSTDESQLAEKMPPNRVI